MVGVTLAVDSGFLAKREPPDVPKPVVVAALVVEAAAPNGVGVALVVDFAPNKLVVAPAAPKEDGAAVETGG